MISYSLSCDMRPAPGTPVTPSHYDQVIGMIRVADELGYQTVWASEQHGMDDGYLPSPLVFLSAVARETERIHLGTGVHLLTLTDPRRVAEEAGVLDVLSSGRLTLGLGAGGNHPHEFDIFGRQLSDRAALMEEGLNFLRDSFSKAIAPDGHPINVAPIQQPVPIIIGGLAGAPIDRAARLANGHLAYSFIDPDDELPRLWRERISPAMERHGRTVGEFRLGINSLIWPSDDWEREWQQHVGPAFLYQQRRYIEWEGGTENDLPELLTRRSWDLEEIRQRMLVGPPDEIGERLSDIRSVYPFDEVATWPLLPGVPVELAEKCLRTFAEDVAPAVTDT